MFFIFFRSSFVGNLTCHLGVLRKMDSKRVPGVEFDLLAWACRLVVTSIFCHTSHTLCKLTGRGWSPEPRLCDTFLCTSGMHCHLTESTRSPRLVTPLAKFGRWRSEYRASSLGCLRHLSRDLEEQGRRSLEHSLLGSLTSIGPSADLRPVNLA